NDGDAEEARAKVAAAGAAPLVFKGSVADAGHVQKTVKELVAAWGGIDVLVNAAGVNHVLPIALLEEVEWDELMAVNVKGVYLFSRAVLRHMIKARRGPTPTIGPFASAGGVRGPPPLPA